VEMFHRKAAFSGATVDQPQNEAFWELCHLARTADCYGVCVLTKCAFCPLLLSMLSQNGTMPFVPTTFVEIGIQFMRLVEYSITCV